MMMIIMTTMMMMIMRMTMIIMMMKMMSAIMPMTAAYLLTGWEWAGMVLERRKPPVLVR
jgi:hypothetical protein